MVKQVLARVTFVWALMFLAFNAYADCGTPADAEALVSKTTDKVLEALKADSSEIYALVDKIVLPHFDFVKMSRSVLGKNWHKFSLDQKKKFVTEFRGLLVRTYSAALVEAAGKVDRIEYSSEDISTEKTQKASVSAKVYQKGKPSPINADYFMYCNKDDEWKAYNIKVAGVNLVNNYRSEFASDIDKIGIDGLIDKIKNPKSK
jgi:phospholipid transport system substrate-binding protein